MDPRYDPLNPNFRGFTQPKVREIIACAYAMLQESATLPEPYCDMPEKIGVGMLLMVDQMMERAPTALGIDEGQLAANIAALLASMVTMEGEMAKTKRVVDALAYYRIGTITGAIFSLHAIFGELEVCVTSGAANMKHVLALMDALKKQSRAHYN